jgi:hypothetical protein
VDHYEKPTLVWRQALVFLKPKAWTSDKKIKLSQTGDK